MEQTPIGQTPNIKTTNTSITKREKGLLIIIGITLLLAFSGIGLGIYGLIENSKKDEQISKLQAQLSSLTNDGNGVNPSINNGNGISQKTKIKIVRTSWNGFAETSDDYLSEEKETYCEVDINEKCVVGTHIVSDLEGNKWEEDSFSFKITSINDDGVDIYTFQKLMEDNKETNSPGPKNNFTIKKNESLTLQTPTLDAGDIYTLTLL